MFDFDNVSDDWLEGYCVASGTVVWSINDGRWVQEVTPDLHILYYFQDVTQE